MAHNASPGGLPVWSLSDRLRKIRRDRHLTQDEFAQALGVKREALSAWEAGRTRPHDVVELAVIIENTYGIPASWTLGVLSGPDQSATNPMGIPVQRPGGGGPNHGRRWTDMAFAAVL
jgi:transcriptional regulator with XRE-family HTH domain